MDKFESENRKWREEKSRQLTAMLSAGEILPCEVRDMTGKLGRLAPHPILEMEVPADVY